MKKLKHLNNAISLKMTQFSILLALVLIFISTNAFISTNMTLQSPPNPDCIETIEYNLEIIKSYHLAPEEISQMTLLELARIKESRELQHHKICLMEGELIHEITVLNPEEVFPPYLKKIPVRREIKNKTTHFFNKQDEMIHQIEHPQHKAAYLEKQRLNIEENGFFKESWLFENTDELVTAFSDATTNEEVILTDNGIFIETDEKQLSIDFDNNTVESVLLKDGEPDYITRTKYKEATDGSTIHDYIYSETHEKTDGNVCFRKVTLLRYYTVKKNGELISQPNLQGLQIPNNTIIENNLATSLNTRTTNDVIISPNPANDIINLSWQLEDAAPNKVTITDTQGRVLLEKRFSESESINLNIATLQTGIYFIHGIGENRNLFSKKFIKN